MNGQTCYLQQTPSQQTSFFEFDHHLLQNFSVKRIFEENSFLSHDFHSQHTKFTPHTPQHQENVSNVEHLLQEQPRPVDVRRSKSFLFQVQEELKLGNFDSRPLSRETLFVESICMIRPDVDVTLITFAHRCILYAFDSAAIDQDIAFLNVAMQLLYDMQNLKKAERPEAADAKSYHDNKRLFEMMNRKLHTRAHPSRVDFTNTSQLANHCKSLLTDLVFHVRFMALSKMHVRHQRAFRVKSVSATLPKFGKKVRNSFQDTSLICAPKTFFNPPVPPTRRPRGGFWIDMNEFDP